MDFLEKLDMLMEQKGLNKSTLSKACDIPYTTIDGWYKKGYEGVKLTTLKKLSSYFGTTLDFWANEDNSNRYVPQSQDEPTPEEIQFLLEEMRAGRGSKEASILYYGGKPKPADEKMLEIEKAIDRRSNLQSMAERTAELILDGENPAMLVSYINDKWEQIPLTEDELKAIRILLQK